MTTGIDLRIGDVGWFIVVLAAIAVVWFAAARKSRPKASPPPPPSSDRIQAALKNARTAASSSREGSFSQAPRPDDVAQIRTTSLQARSRSETTEIEIPPVSTRTSGVGHWVPHTKRITVRGLDIGGMVYVGEGLRRRDGRDAENCLINPRLVVAREKPSSNQVSIPYWPSYSAISSDARRVYLEWLANGRSDPSIEIGFVFLYFYGLERRIFVDREDASVIVAEVERLRSIYSRVPAFDTYSRTLLNAAALTESEPAHPVLSPEMGSGFEMPLNARRYLGTRLASRQPLSSDDALMWILSTPDTHLRTPAVRCFREFCDLWNVRFSTRYPNGLRINIPRTRLKAEYRAASGSFTVPIEVGSLPDIAAITAPLAPLRDIVSACTDDLAAYSRLLGRKPDAAGTAEAAALLPVDLLDSAASASLRRIRDVLAEQLDTSHLKAMPTMDLCAILGVDLGMTEKLPAEAERQVASVLDRLGIGFEPDRRHGPSGLSRAGSVVIFLASEGGTVEGDRAQYTAARTMVEVAALAAVSDGEVAAGEIVAIERDIESFAGLRPAEIARLSARVRVLLSDPPKQQATLNRLAKLSVQERSGIAHSALAAILADGQVRPAEVKFLERLHKSLGLPTEAVHTLLHREALSRDEPAIISVEARSSGVAIPPERSVPPSHRQPESELIAPHAADSGVRIDAGRLARVKSETAAVAAILGSIFADEDVPVAAPSPARSSQRVKGLFEGLDTAHGELLSGLLHAGAMDRDSFSALAARLKLMTDGAIGTINDWAFDRFDDVAIEDSDEICVVASMRPGIEALRGETT